MKYLRRSILIILSVVLFGSLGGCSSFNRHSENQKPAPASNKTSSYEITFKASGGTTHTSILVTYRASGQTQDYMVSTPWETTEKLTPGSNTVLFITIWIPQDSIDSYHCEIWANGELKNTNKSAMDTPYLTCSWLAGVEEGLLEI